MGMFKDFKKEVKKVWAGFTVSDKIKIGLRVLTAIGSGCIGGVLSAKYIESEKPGVFETAAVVTTAYGASLALSNVAYKSLENYVDAWGNLKNSIDNPDFETPEEPETVEEVG